MSKIRGIFCLNSKCKHYFEDNCMLLFKESTVHISVGGCCEDFEMGKHIDYETEESAEQK